MMKKLLTLVLVLALAGVATAGLSIDIPVPDERGSSTNEMENGGSIVLDVWSNVGLSGLDACITVTNGTISGAINLADATRWDGASSSWFFYEGGLDMMGMHMMYSGGWEKNLSFDPTGIGTASAEIGLGTFSAIYPLGYNDGMGSIVGRTAYIELTSDGSGEDMVVTITGCSNFGGSYLGNGSPVGGDFFDGASGTVYVIPEPITIALMGLGGLLLRRRK